MAETIGRGILAVGFDQAQAAQAAKEFQPTIGRITGDLARSAVAVKLFQVGKEGLDELKQAEVANTQLGAVIQSTGNKAGISAEHIDELSQKALHLAGVDDEAAKNADTLLLQLGKFANTDLGHENFDRAATAAVNLSIRMGTDVPAAAQALAVVLQAPEKGLGRLRRSVGDLSAEQQASLDHFVAVGDEASAQAVILDKLDQSVGGAGAAYGETLAGKVAIAQESMKNMKAELVAGAAPALKLGADAVTFLTAKVDDLPPAVQTGVGAVVLLGGGVAALARPVGDLARLLDRFRSAAPDVGTSLNTVAVGADSVASSAAAAASGTAELSTDLNTVATASAAVVTKLAVHTAAAQELAAAQAEQILAMRGIDEATIQEVVSNEALEFSDEQVAVAQTQRLLTSDPLIAAEEALAITTVEEAAAADLAAASNLALASSQLGLSEAALSGNSAVLGMGGVGLIAAAGVGVVAGAVAALTSVFQDNVQGASDYAAAMQSAAQQTDATADTIKTAADKVTATKLATIDSANAAADAGISWQTMGREISSGTDNLDKWSRLASTTNGDSKQFAANLTAAGAGATRFGLGLIDALNSGKLTNTQVVDLLNNVNGLRGGFQQGKDAADHQSAALDGISGAANDAADGTDAAAAATDQLSAAQSKAIDDAYRKSLDDLAKKAKDVTTNADQARAAVLRLAPADIRVQQGKLTIADDQARVQQAQAKLDADKAAGASADQLAQDERDLESAQLSAQQAVLDEAQALTDLKVAQDEAAGKTDTTTDKTNIYISALGDLDAELKGPLHDTIAQNITDMYTAAVTANAAADATEHWLDVQRRSAVQQHAQDVGQDYRQAGHYAMGGGVGPNEPFIAGEHGFEILATEGLYQAPPKGGYVMNHAQSERFVSAQMSGGSSPYFHADTLIVQGRDATEAVASAPDAMRADAWLRGG